MKSKNGLPGFTAEKSFYPINIPYRVNRGYFMEVDCLEQNSIILQVPNNSPGKTLHKKGDCKRVSTNFSECVYCENQDLTVNCKTYWCSDNGTCEPKPLLQFPRGPIDKINRRLINNKLFHSY